MQEVDVYYVKGKYPVFTVFLNQSLEEIKSIKEKIIEYRKENPVSNISNVKSWHSHYLTYKHTRCFDDINLRILNTCDSILNKFNDTKDRLMMGNMWMNIYEKGDRATLHNHFPSDISCCYYADIEENSSPIKFPPELEIFPKNDMLVIFPGNLHHEVLPTNGRRIVIAMNLDYPRRPSNSPTHFEYFQ